MRKSFKQHLTESIKAEDFEAAIVIGWHQNNGQDLDYNAAGISQKVYKSLMRQPEYIEAGKKIAAAIQKHFGLGNNVKAEQYGRAKSSLTAFWKGYGATDTTPKTDILIGDKRLSLKIGMAQLMSGGKAESMATFYAAMEKSQINESPQLQKVVGIFDNFVTASLAPGQLRPIIKSGENEIVNRGEAAHKEVMTELGLLFETNEKFKIEFAREAMSGFMKYGENSNSAAEFMVVSDHNGTSVKITSVYDDAYCKQIADKMKLQARFKTSSRKLKGKKTGEYNFWSVISLIVDAKPSLSPTFAKSLKVKYGDKKQLSPKEKKEIEDIFDTMSYADVEVIYKSNITHVSDLAKIHLQKAGVLKENMFRNLLSKIKGKFGSVLQKAKSFITGKISNVLKFFGVEPVISVNDKVEF
jgi:hypothetical protein